MIMQTRALQEKWLDDLLIFSPPRRSQPISQFLEDNLLVSAPSIQGRPGGLYHLKKTTWFASAELQIIDLLDTSGLYLQSNLFLRSLQNKSTLFLVAYSQTGQTWTIANSELKNIHDMVIFEHSLYVVSCFTNEIAKISMTGEIEERWKFGNGAHTWHINCLSVWDNRLVATCSGRFDVEPDWASDLGRPGQVFDVKTGDILWSDLAHPHAPGVDRQNRKYVCDSKGQKVLIKESSGNIIELKFPGSFPKALAWGKNMLYVGLAKYRFPLAGQKGIDSARIAIVNLKDFSIVDYIDLPIDEMYNIVVVPDDLSALLPR